VDKDGTAWESESLGLDLLGQFVAFLLLLESAAPADIADRGDCLPATLFAFRHAPHHWQAPCILTYVGLASTLVTMLVLPESCS